MLENYYFYESAIRKIFPELEILDEMELPKIIKFDLENSLTLPFIRPSYYVNDEIKTLIQRFLHQYFTLYDSKNRIELCHAYDENAYFSLSSGGTSASFLNKKHSDIKTYLVGSRNLERIKDKDRRRKYMHQGCDKIASFLNLLPDTIHDYPSFVVDVVLYTNTLLVFSLTGFFKDSAKREFETGLIRYFSRTFYTIPFGQGIKIINDMLYIMPPAQDMIKKAFVNNISTSTSQNSSIFLENHINQPSHNPYIMPRDNLQIPQININNTNRINQTILDTEPSPSHKNQFSIHNEQQTRMLTAFASETGMNLAWAQKCLIDNEGNYVEAMTNFNKCKAEGIIPPEAFS